MCGVIGQLSLDFSKSAYLPTINTALKKKELGDFTPNYNIWTGMYALVVGNFEPDRYQYMMFGLTPFWADKKTYFFNARSEGKFNKKNDINYSGEKGIFEMPSFRHCIRNKRCVIPVDYFVEGTEKNKLKEPFLIKKKLGVPIILGGIWDEWIDKNTGEILRSFAIVTTPSAPLLQKLPHHRSPLILSSETANWWLNSKTDLNTIKGLLKPADTSDLIAYPIENTITKRLNDPQLILPKGDIIE